MSKAKKTPEQAPMQPKEHVGYPYPTEFPSNVVGYIIDYLRGNDVEFACLVNSGWALVGYGLSKAFPHEMTAKTPTVKNIKGVLNRLGEGSTMEYKELANALEMMQRTKGVTAEKSFDWISLTRTILQIILSTLL